MLKLSFPRVLAGFGHWTRSSLALIVATLVLVGAALPGTALAGEEASPPTVVVSFSPSTIAAGGSSVMTVTISNPNVVTTLTGISLTDTYPPGLTPTSIGAYSCFPGSGVFNASGFVVSGVTLAPSSQCQIPITVTAASAAVYTNVTGAPTSAQSGTGFAGSGSLTVTNPPSPTVTSLSPTSGPTAGGTSVVITGTNLTGATAVKFGTTNATSFTVNSATQITAVGPAGSGGSTVDVTVTGPGGTSATSASDQFTYLSPPIIAAAFSPTSINTNSTSVLTLTLTNPNAIALTGIGFSDTYPAGITPTLIGAYTCSAGSALFNGTGLSFSSVTLGPGASCQVPVTVTAASAAVYTNVTSAPTSTNGGTGSTASATLTVTNPPPPTVTSLSPTSGPTAGGTSVVITGTNFTGATAVKFGTTNATSFTVNSATQITAVSPAGSGAVDVTVTATGGTSATSSADQFLFMAAPTFSLTADQTSLVYGQGATVTATITNPNAAAITGVNFEQLSFATGGNTYVAVASPANVINPCGLTFSAPAGGSAATLTGGTVPANSTCVINYNVVAGNLTFTFGNVRFVSSDNATNSANATLTFTITAPPPPSVTSLSPSSGPTVGGTSVILSGTNLTGATAVKFGTTDAASFTVNSATQITAVSPAGTGVVFVTVTTPAGTSSAASANRFTYVAAPTVSAISPASGPLAGGTSVLVVGGGFTGATSVKFGTTNATSFTVTNAGALTAVAPAGSGVVDITVTTVGGTSATSSADQFTYAAVPSVTVVSPALGAPGGGNSVVIIGTAFTSASAVKFGTTNAASFTVNSATVITAVSPAGSGVVDITVTTPGGTSSTSSADQFTYAAVPSVTVVSPALGAPGGGNSVVITGTAFTSASAVKFGTTNATSFTVNSATQITAVSPAGSGTVDITVTTVGGTSATSSADRFTYAATLTTTQAVASTTLTINTLATPFIPVTSAGGFGTVSYALSGGSLPTGLAFNTATGQITGTPTATLAATTFTVTATDTAPTPQTSSKTFSLTVTVAAPVAAAKTITVGYQTAFTFDLTNDITGAATSLAVATQAAHGTVTTTGLTLTYTPAAGYSGPDSFTYTAVGPGGTSAAKTVTVSVNGAPVALARSVTVQPDPSKTGATVPPIIIDLTSSVQNAVSIIISTQPAHGTVSVNGFIVTYTPTPGFFGTDSFSYQAVGATGSVNATTLGLNQDAHTLAAAPSGPLSAAATVSITLATPAITAPTLTATVLQGKPVTVNLTDTATGGPFTAATVVSVSPSGAGTASIVAQGSGFALQFTSAGTFSGVATVSYTLSNSFSTSLPGQVVVTVQARPDPTLDPDVRGLVSAEVEDARRFASVQMENFDQRMELLHHGAGPSGSSVQLNLGFAAMPLGKLNPASGPWSYWISGTVNLARRTAAGGVATDLSTQGVSAGADVAVSDQWSFGLGGGFSHGNDKIGTAGTRLDASNGTAAIYSSWHTGRGAYVDLVAGFSTLSYDTTRYSAPGAVFLTGSRSGRENFASVTSGFDFETEGGWRLTPYGRVSALSGSLEAYTETGSTTWALTYDRQSLSSVNGALGGHAERTYAFDGGEFTPKLRVEYQWELKDLGAVSVRYADWAASPTYTSTLLGIDKGRLVVGAGVDVKMGKANFNLDYSTTANSGFETEQRIRIGGSMKF